MSHDEDGAIDIDEEPATVAGITNSEKFRVLAPGKNYCSREGPNKPDLTVWPQRSAALNPLRYVSKCASKYSR